MVTAKSRKGRKTSSTSGSRTKTKPKTTSRTTKKPAAKRGTAKSAARAKPAPAVPSVAAQLPPVTAAQKSAARKKFEQGVVTRGEAVPAGQPLTRGATHEIVGKRADGTPILKRKRFSLT